MQSIMNETSPALWDGLAPLLDDALENLNGKDHDALVLRFFENKNFAEVGVALGASENAAKMRVTRALEKLRKFFAKHGVASTTAIIGGVISANSVQAAPAGLAQTISAAAMAKGAAASTSTLTLVKGTLKLMAWTKAKAAIATIVIVLLAVGTTTFVGVKEYEGHRTYAWEIPKVYKPEIHDFEYNYSITGVVIKASIYKGFMGGEAGDYAIVRMSDGTWVETNSDHWQSIGLGVDLGGIVRNAYGNIPRWQTITLTKLSKGPFDYISNVPQGKRRPLQDLIRKKFGIVGKWVVTNTDVLLLELANPDVHGFKPAGSLLRSMGLTVTNPPRVGPLPADFIGAGDYDLGFSGRQKGNSEIHFNSSIDDFVRMFSLEDDFHVPIINDTGLTNRYDYEVTVNWSDLKGTFRDQLGLEFVPARRPFKMLVIEKVK